MSAGTWQTWVYGGGSRPAENVPKPSNYAPGATETSHKAGDMPDMDMTSILAFDGSTIEAARDKLCAMRQSGITWYRLSKMYQRPAGTIQHWANGVGIPDEEVVEKLLKTKLIYVTIEAGTRLVPACPDCGEPHAAQERCHGDPVEVVLLRPGQRVATTRTRPVHPEVQRMTAGLLKAAERAGIRDGDTILMRGTKE